MSRNIKEIGKELMGKSLNSFHRKTGLTQLEENNKMQDGILDGILSQVDDAYIEKTEQSNVIHLDGSGDGAVVLDSIEGNTMVNLFKGFDVYKSSGFKIISKTKLKMIGNGSYPTIYYKDYILKPNTKYTLIVNVDKLDISNKNNEWVILRVGEEGNTNAVVNNPTKTGLFIQPFTTPNVEQINNLETYMRPSMTSDDIIELSNMVILEGDWTNKEIPPYFEGLQSSFEEKVNDEGKYEIEILIKNKNLFDGEMEDGAYGASGAELTYPTFRNKNKFILVEPNTKYNLQCINSGEKPVIHEYDENKTFIRYDYDISRHGTHERTKYINFRTQTNTLDYKFQLEKGDVLSEYIPHKTNKIKLLLNSPLLKGDEIKVVDGKLCHIHNYGSIEFDGSDDEKWQTWSSEGNILGGTIDGIPYDNSEGSDIRGLCDKLPVVVNGLTFYDNIGFRQLGDSIQRIYLYKVGLNNTGVKTWLQTNPLKIVYKLLTPWYEEILNEYGEPIILEGYENGTIYIDSTIVPTTTLKYTPRMQSFKTLKEVENNNIMLTNDVNDNIIPYMMDVDMMILEKEMALMSHTYKLRRTGEKDMTSMQKRTQDMLERLIKGKTLTEQECKTRVTTYLNAGKITDAQAEELMLLIDEVYA